MDFIFPVDDKVKNKLKNLNIENISLYLYSDINEKLQYKKNYYVISNNILYIIDDNFKILNQYNNNDIDEIKIEYLLNYGRVYFIKDNKYQLVGCFSKSQSKFFAIFEKYALKVLKNEMTEEDYQNKDIINTNETI